MHRSAVILAGGASTRFGEDKGLMQLSGKPLIKHVLDSIQKLVDDIVVVTCSQERIQNYTKVVGADIKFAVDERESEGPLIGALTGFGAATGEYALLVPFDTPFISPEVVTLLFELCSAKAATIPRWPNGQIEPLHAVYKRKTAFEAAKLAIEYGRLDLRGMIERLKGVRFISTLVIKQLDPKLMTFFNVNTPIDLKKATTLSKYKKDK